MIPTKETDEGLRAWWPVRFTLIVLMASAGVIALVWLGTWFPDQADHPGYWTAAVVIVPLALLLIATSVWMVRKFRPTPPEADPRPIRPTKGIAYMAASGAATCLAQGWTDLHGPSGSRVGPWSPFFYLALAILFLVGTVRQARLFVRREEWPAVARPPAPLWLYWAGAFCIAANTIRSVGSLLIAAGLTTIFVAGLMLYFHTHRTPEGEPFRRSDSEMAR